jgi:hypothetical protein
MPILFSASFVNPAGEASFSIPIPSALAGLTVFVQLAELSSCRASELEVTTL